MLFDKKGLFEERRKRMPVGGWLQRASYWIDTVCVSGLFFLGEGLAGLGGAGAFGNYCG